MSPIDRMLIEHQCSRLILNYAVLNDAGDFDALAALYTEQGRFARPTDPDKVIQGRAAILAEFRARPARLSRHIMSNIVVSVESPTRARAQSRVLLFLGAATEERPAPLEKTLVGEFHDLLEKVGEDWLFAERRGSLTIKG